MSDDAPERSFQPGQVPDDGQCHACGSTLPSDGEEEYRHRFVLEDHSRSSESAAFGRLCGKCWWRLYDFVGGNGNALDR